jgi:hypothetical protein
MMNHFFSVDLGNLNDYTAISILRREPSGKPKEALPGTPDYAIEKPSYRSVYRLVWLERLPLGMDYPSIVKRISDMMQHRDLHRNTHLLVDATGVGLPIVQMMRNERLGPIGISITGGAQVTRNEAVSGYNVPKGELVSAMNLVFQSRRIRIPSNLPMKQEFMKELERFEVTIKKNATTYEAAVASVHDDLVLSVAMGCWYAEKTYGATFNLPGAGRRQARGIENPLKELL